MKRYLVFAGDVYYPMGGAYDLDFDTDDKEEALKYMEKHDRDYGWCHIYDSQEKDPITKY